MLYIICCLIAFFSCSIGTVCGMGGGIIIKPVLDATGVMSVSTINFLSGCTVICMTCWTVGKTLIKKESVIDVRNTTILAVSAAIGGIIGKDLFTKMAANFPNPDKAGGIQAAFLFAVTLATFIYTLNKERIKPKNIKNALTIIVLGLALGVLGSFLGIGGGPFNVAALYYFFDMPAKKAAQNSLYVILFSQLTSTMRTVINGGIPEFSVWILVGMIVLGVAGSELGRRINAKIDDKTSTKFLDGAMILIMCINIFNVAKFFLFS